MRSACPQQLLDLGDRVRVVIDPQTLLGEAEREKSDGVSR